MQAYRQAWKQGRPDASRSNRPGAWRGGIGEHGAVETLAGLRIGGAGKAGWAETVTTPALFAGLVFANSDARHFRSPDASLPRCLAHARASARVLIMLYNQHMWGLVFSWARAFPALGPWCCSQSPIIQRTSHQNFARFTPRCW